jgi:hypothetical protein
VIRLFHVYYPIRTLILLAGEALIVWTSFLVAAVLVLREDSYLVLNYEYGYLKLFVFTGVVLLCSHWFDLYDTARLNTRGELYFRLLMVPAVLAFVTAGISYIRWHFLAGVWVTAGWCSCPCWSNASMFSGRPNGPNAWCRASARILKSASRLPVGRANWKAQLRAKRSRLTCWKK